MRLEKFAGPAAFDPTKDAATFAIADQATPCTEWRYPWRCDPWSISGTLRKHLLKLTP